MKKFRLLMFTLATFLCFNVISVSAQTISQEVIDSTDRALQEKLNQLFEDGEITIKVANTYNKVQYNVLPQIIKDAAPYESWVKGGVLEFIALYNEKFFGDDIKVDTGIVYEGKKIYADGSFSYGDENTDIYANFSYTVYWECIEDLGCGGVSGSVQIPLDVTLDFIEPDETIEAKITSYRNKMAELEVLKYDDLYWVNMLLATNLQGIFAQQVITGNAARYLLSPITQLDPDIDMYIDNRRGGLNTIVDSEGNYNDEDLLEVQFGGEFPIFYKGVLYDNIGGTSFDIYYGNSINIPNTTTQENYISAVESRINNYINNDDYKITVTKTNFNVQDDIAEAIRTDWLPNDIFTIYNLNITYNGKSFDHKFVIKKVPAEDIVVPKVSFLELENGIMMSTDSSDVPNNSVIKVTKVEDENKKSIIEMYLNTDKSTAYDIKLEGSNGIIKIINNGVVTVKIPLPVGYDESATKIYYVSDDGKSGEEFDVSYETIDETRYVVFNTTHFSTYVVAEGASIGVENPKTSDGIMSSIIFGGISLLGILGCLLFFKKRKSLTKI